MKQKKTKNKSFFFMIAYYTSVGRASAVSMPQNSCLTKNVGLPGAQGGMTHPRGHGSPLEGTEHKDNGLLKDKAYSEPS